MGGWKGIQAMNSAWLLNALKVTARWCALCLAWHGQTNSALEPTDGPGDVVPFARELSPTALAATADLRLLFVACATWGMNGADSPADRFDTPALVELWRLSSTLEEKGGEWRFLRHFPHFAEHQTRVLSDFEDLRFQI